MVKVLNYSCAIMFTFGTLGKDMNPDISFVTGKILSLLFFYEDGLALIKPRKLIFKEPKTFFFNLSSSLVGFKKGREHITTKTAQVFILWMRF